MKRKGIIALTVASLCLGVLSVGGAITYAAFSTKKNLDRYTTVKHMVMFAATGDCSWWNTASTKTAIYLFKKSGGTGGQFANDGAFMDYHNDGTYTAVLPPNKDASNNVLYDYIIFVRCNSDATIGSWSAMSYAADGAFQTVDIPYTGEYAEFTMYHSTDGQSAGSGQSLVPGGNTTGKRGGMWSNNVTTYSYSAA